MTTRASTTQAPKESKAWITKQIYVGATSSVTLFLVGYHFLPLRMTNIKTSADALVFTVQCLFISSLPMLANIHYIGDKRFNSKAIDPVRGGGEDVVDVPNRILRNTVEQFLVHAVALLTLSTFLDEASLKAIPILSGIFVLYRLLFWWGYMKSPLNRTVGMAGTFCPTILVYIYCLYCIVRTTFL
jgi:uncharacterized membrane protein YecN with MAPEG domain